MDSRSLRRRTVALIAAYAVALQALLSSFVALAPAIMAGPFGVICSHDESGGASHPVQHDLPCAAICATLGHGIAGPVPPDVAIAYARPQAIAALAPIHGWIVPRIRTVGPQAPRGPPLG